jgi:hypothetical protein
MAEWHTVASARDQWVDAPTDDGVDEDATLSELLSAAKTAVLAYAPAFEGLEVVDGYIVNDPDAVPDAYRIAQLMQARNIWNSSKASPAGSFDNGEYGLTSFPLDWQVRQLLRPKQGRPVIA